MSTITFDFDALSIRKMILDIFNYLKKIELLPKNIVCFLPSLNTNYFYNPINQNFFEYTFNKLERNKNYFAPYDYSKLLGLDWIYYYNLSDIVLLENFCKIASIDLKWTVKDELSEEIILLITQNFKGYFKYENN